MFFAFGVAIVAVTSGPAGIQGAPTSGVTIQQAFDAATALSDAGKHAEAAAAWAALEQRTSRNARTQAIVRIRKGTALLRLNRLDEASQSVKAGLAALPPTDPALTEDRVAAHLALASIDQRALDYASALGHYNAAGSIAQDASSRFVALLGAVRTGAFVDPDAAAVAADDLLRAVSGPSVEPRVRAAALTAISEQQMNAGKLAEARASATRAVKDLGGLTLKATSLDAAARSDVALAALMLGDKDEARRYLAYTGAGRTKVQFPSGQIELPPCGGDTGILPDDVAVIEFTIDDDGAVTDSAPVFASRKGNDVALSFARAARDWSFSPDSIKDLPEFFRTRTRLEVRCSTAFPRPSLNDYLRAELSAWLEGKGAPLRSREQPVATRLRADRAALTNAAAGDPLALAPVLFDIAESPLSGRDETAAAATRALAILIREGAPPLARLAVERLVWSSSSTEGSRSGRYRDALRRAVAVEPYAGDAASRNVLKLALADALLSRSASDARPLLQAVGEDFGLAANHPLRVGALVRLASLEQRKGNPAAAQQAFQKSGLSAQQCALLDAPPKFLSINSSEYPQEAQAWGFEGWARAQLDVDAAGRSVSPRVVVAYPPFVFGEATMKMAAGARYEKSFRPDGGLGCGGLLFPVRFVLSR